MVRPSLRKWFVIHFIVDYVVAVPLMAAPCFLLQLFGWETVDPVSARLTAAALIGVGGVSMFSRSAGADVYLHLLQLKLLWSAGAVIRLGVSGDLYGVLFHMGLLLPASGFGKITVPMNYQGIP